MFIYSHEIHTTGRANNSTTFVDNWANRGPVRFLDIVSAIHHTLVAFTDEVYFATQVNAHSYHRSNGGIHTLRVSTASEDRQALPFMRAPLYKSLSTSYVHCEGQTGTLKRKKLHVTNIEQ